MENNTANLIYNVEDKVPFKKNMLFALQQVLSVIVATMLMPLLVDPSGVYLSQSAALIGAGVGTIIYLCLTKFKSPIFLGSSFGFIAPVSTALAFGYFGILLGAVFAGLVYVVLAIVIKFVGVDWINKVMPPIVIGPVVALIGFNLAGGAISDLMNTSGGIENYSLLSILIGLITFFVTILVSVKGSKKLKLYPFLIGIVAGYLLSGLFTVFGIIFNVEALKIIDFSVFSKITDFNNWLPNLTFVGVFKEGFDKISSFGNIITIFTAFVPIAFVSFAEHIADHKNLGSIVNRDLIKNPGLVRTLLGDGLGSMIGATFGGCPNTTYGESIGCVALSKNASTRTILLASTMCIIIAFFYPLVLFVESIPSCVVGGISIALFGFISVSGLRMFKDFDLNDSKNLFIVASIFISGIGGLFLKFGSVEISNIACALIIGIITNLLLSNKKGAKISENTELIAGDKTIQKNTQKIDEKIDEKDDTISKVKQIDLEDNDEKT